jgi:hypothetical protein
MRLKLLALNAAERWLLRLISELCFGSSRVSYEWLIKEWSFLSDIHPGWSLTEIALLTPRERKNWIELAKEEGKAVKRNGV